jgi:hypothetical protein
MEKSGVSVKKTLVFLMKTVYHRNRCNSRVKMNSTVKILLNAGFLSATAKYIGRANIFGRSLN